MLVPCSHYGHDALSCGIAQSLLQLLAWLRGCAQANTHIQHARTCVNALDNSVGQFAFGSALHLSISSNEFAKDWAYD
jgi:hypothetical protein